MINIAKAKDAIESDLHIIIFLCNADSVQQIEELSNFEFLGGNLAELVVVEGHLHSVINVEPF
jgi:hypothetical protein